MAGRAVRSRPQPRLSHSECQRIAIRLPSRGADVARESACVLRPTDQPLSWFLTARPIKHIGTVSYGIYLVHILCINVVRRVVHLDGGLIVFALALPLSVVVATVIFRFYETPFLQLKRLTRPSGRRASGHAYSLCGDIFSSQHGAAPRGSNLHAEDSRLSAVDRWRLPKGVPPIQTLECLRVLNLPFARLAR